ncbi:MAG: hypothetical protein WAL47_15190, partial [Pyrinomonadaceae bacterium]
MNLTKQLALVASLYLCVGVMAKAVGIPTNQTASIDKPIETDFCELISTPEKYLRKVIRTVAVYSEGFEGNGLSKAECPAGKNVRETIWGRIASADTIL